MKSAATPETLHDQRSLRFSGQPAGANLLGEQSKHVTNLTYSGHPGWTLTAPDATYLLRCSGLATSTAGRCAVADAPAAARSGRRARRRSSAWAKSFTVL